MSNSRIYIMMVFSSLLTSGAYISGKLAVTQFEPVALTFFRFLIAAPVIFVVLYLKEPDSWRLKKSELSAICMLGLLGIVLYHVLFFSSLRLTTAIDGALIGAASPVLVALLSLIFLREALPWSRVLGIMISFLGVLITVTNGNLHLLADLNLNSGGVSMLGAVIIWAVYSMSNLRVMNNLKISPLKLTAYSFLVGVIGSLPLFMMQIRCGYHPHATLEGWLALSYLAICCSVLAYLFYNTAISTIGVSQAAAFANFIPVFVIIQSVLFLHESYEGIKLLSTLMILTGVYLTNRTVPLFRLSAFWSGEKLAHNRIIHALSTPNKWYNY